LVALRGASTQHCPATKAIKRNSVRENKRESEKYVAQKMFKAKITPATGGSGVEVTVPANDYFQAKKMIEAQYGPIKTWWSNPTEVR
jgi:hypothetical protein